MNLLLWIVQALLALLYVAGGAYKFFSFDALASQMSTLPRSGWRVLGAIEMLGGVLLIVPAATKWLPMLTPLAAAVLVLETLALSGLYARYSLDLTASNPLVWSVVMMLLTASVAYGRYAVAPLA